MYTEYELKYITYTTTNFTEPIGIRIFGRAGFNVEFKDQVKILKRIKLNRQQSNFLHKLTKGLETEEQYYLAIRNWLNEHPELVTAWQGNKISE